MYTGPTPINSACIYPVNHTSQFTTIHSTISAVILVVNNIASYMDKRKYCAAVFIALSKAFDTVARCLPIQTLYNIGFDSVAYRWFQNSLSERFQDVKPGNIKPGAFTSNKGCSKRISFGPCLVYNNNVPSLYNCNVHPYVDDIIL